MKLIIFLITLNCFGSEVVPYKETDNQSMSKYERIGSIEKYLSNLSNTLKSMDEKIEMQNKQIKELQSAKATKEVATPSAERSLIDKMQAEINALKKDDLKKIQDDVTTLQSDIQFFREILKSSKSL
jgi:Mg2+ and Co2+ transporter CorA